jgi:hypothetical protein
MPYMRPFLAALLLAMPLHAQTAAEIMARVAANQDAADAARSHYIYTQHAHLSSRRGKTILCEETTDYRVTPTETGSQKDLQKLDGRLFVNHHYRSYNTPPTAHTTPEELQDDPSLSAKERERRRVLRKAIDDEGNMDQDLVENMRKNLTDEKSKDGLHAGLFPLTTRAQSQYDFLLKGRERRNGRDTFHITFKPKDENDYDWRGDVWIDTTAFQPVFVQTALARDIPFAVRMLTGTSVPGLGFAATYAAQPDGTWFPTTFGTEFKINVLFFLHRTITVNVENREFQKTHVTSRIVEGSRTEP